MYARGGHSDHEPQQYYAGKIISTLIFLGSPGHDILYFSSAAVVERFQSKRDSIGLGLRTDSASALDLAMQ